MRKDAPQRDHPLREVDFRQVFVGIESPDSRLYRWNQTGFAEMPSIPTDSAHDWEE